MPNLRPTKEEVIALETAYWDAMKAKDGSKTAALSGDPSLVSGAQGVMTIPRSKMSGMTEQGDWTLESYAFENIEISTPTPDVAIIAYTVTQEVVMKGEKKTLHAADSSTWIRGAEGWICHAHSEAYLAEAPKT